jgi:glycosyltransferase involved in cell wall biosynthesis
VNLVITDKNGKIAGMLSIVVPVFNEEESLMAFFAELEKEIKKLHEPFEVVFVDDGSTDGSFALLRELEKKEKNVRVFSFRKNQGKAEALTAGFQKAKGDTIVTLDADLQDQPSEIQKLIAKQRNEGFDAVSGWRKNRKDKSKMVIISRIFNFFAGDFFGVNLHDYNCGLKIYTAEAAKSLRLYGGLHRFIPLLLHQQGFTVDEVVVEHQPRKYGKSKYGFSKVFKDLPDMFTMLFLAKYTKRPLHFFGTVGGLLTFAGFAIFCYLSALRFFFDQSIGNRPLLLFSVFMMLSGFQIFFTGFLAELFTSFSQKDNLHFPLKYSSDKKT